MLFPMFYMEIVGPRKTAYKWACNRQIVCDSAACRTVSFVEWSLLVAGGRVAGDISRLGATLASQGLDTVMCSFVFNNDEPMNILLIPKLNYCMTTEFICPCSLR